jgi:Concanavalin A-like lectin/glucanases superfamily/K319L-like, PKD domain
MKKLFASFIVAATVLLALPSAFAQINSTRVLTDVGTWVGTPPGIDGMELRGAGLYWWKLGAQNEIAGYEATLGVAGGISKYSLSLDRRAPFYMIQGGDFIAGAERDGTYAYFTANRGGDQVGLFRQPLSSAVNATPQRLVGIIAPEISTGAIGRNGSDLYFAPTYAGGYTEIRRSSFDEAGNFAGAGIVASADLHPYAVRRLLFFNANLTGTYERWGLCLQADGALWRFGPLSSALQPMVLLTTGVGDVAIRYDDGGVDVQIVRDRIYASPNTSAAGNLVQVDPATGAKTVFDPNLGSQQFSAFGLDNNFFFFTRISGEILRKFAPFRHYLPNPVPGQPAGWTTIETSGGGKNLRSDGRWLYFTRGNEIRRIGTDVPPIILDIQAFGIEAVQIVQDFNNSVPLIAGKPVLVRGYARLAANSDLSKPTRQPAANLTAFRNNVFVGAYAPENWPQIGNEPASSLAVYRSASTNSFNFVVPAEVVQSGTMSFTFQVNSEGNPVETGVPNNPYANNTISTPVMQVVTTGVPRLTCMPVQVDQRVYTLQTDPPAFWNQIGRAISLLPIPDISVRTVDLLIQKPVFRVGIPPVVYRSFDLPDNETAAINWIRVAIAGSGIYFKGGDTHFLGMVDPGIEGCGPNCIFNGKGSRPGEVLLVRMDGKGGKNAWDIPRGGQTLAHELGHNYGLTHVNFSDTGEAVKETNGEYPVPVSTISPKPNTSREGVFGWDPRSESILDGGTVADLMSYGSTRWLSPYSLNRLRGLIASENEGLAASASGLAKARAGAGVAGDIFLISGMVNTVQARAELWPAQRVPAGTYDAAAVAASIAQAAQPQGHDYVVRQVDVAGAILSASPLLLERTGDGFGERIGFVQFLEAAPGAVALQVAIGGTILANLDGSGAAPSVTGNALAYDADAHLLQWSWTAADADGNPLFSNVHFSADGGANWQPVELFSGNSSVSLDTKNLPGGTQCLLRVVVTDGFNTALAVTDAFFLPTHPPEITIIGVTEGEKLAFGTPAELQAFAMDAEEGSLPGSGVSWALSGPEPATKTGRTLSLSGLPPGNYSATATAIDAAGEAGSATRTIEVRPISIPEAAAPALDGEVDDAGYSSAPSVRWAYGGTGRISARLTRAGGRLYIGFTDLPYRNSGSTRAVVGIRVDIDGSADAAVQSSDLGFFVDEDGRPVQREGNGSTMVLRASPAAGFDSAISSGELSWTAEFCMPEAILGGAEHGIRILLTMEVPDAGGSLHTYGWPAAADPNSPATWAPVQLGALPPPANAAPLALAGGDRLVAPEEAMTIILDGRGSTDPEGQSVSYQWTQVDGEPVSLSGADTAQPSFSINPVTDTSVRRFELVVNDGELDSAPAAVSLTAAPVAFPSPPRDVPRFIRYPDGTFEGYFTPADFGPFDVGTAPVGAGGEFSIGTQGLYNIETSEDLLTWTPRFDTSPDLLARLIFKDSSATGLPQRFYRARLLGADGVLSPGYALQFDGAARSVQVLHAPAFNAYPITISAWINTTNTAAQAGGIVSKYADASANGWTLFSYAGSVRGSYFASPNSYVWDGGFGLDGGFIADGAWHYVVMTFGAAGGTIYVDGVSRNSLNWVGAPGPCTTTQPLQIGRYFNYPNGFIGQIDEVSIWSVELSGLQVLDLYRRAPTGMEANLEGLWELDDGTGSQAVDSAVHAGLVAGAQHDGALINNPLWVPSTAPIRR